MNRRPWRLVSASFVCGQDCLLGALICGPVGKQCDVAASNDAKGPALILVGLFVEVAISITVKTRFMLDSSFASPPTCN
jgi:hypothetical protein